MGQYEGICQVNSISSLQQCLIVTAITLRFLMGGIDGSLLPLGISSIVWDFGGDNASVLFLIEGIVFASALIFSGRLGDRFGLKPIFLTGIVFFTLGSFLSSIAGSMIGLIVCRLLSSVGLTMSLAVSLPIIMVFIPEGHRGRSIGYTVMGMSIGSVIGPVICGLILQYLGWAYTFLVLVPVGISILIIGYLGIPAGPCQISRIGYDYPGFFLTFLTLGIFSIGMNLGLLDQNPVFFAQTLIISVIAGVLFILWERRTQDPLIDLSFLTRKAIYLPLIITFCLYCVYRISLYFMPIYLSEILNFSPFLAGMIMSICAVIPAVGSPLSGFFIEQKGMKGIRQLLILSGIFGFFASVCMIGTPILGGIIAVFFSLFFLGIMFALGWTAVYGLYYSSVSLDHAGMAGGIIETASEFSALMAISFVQFFFAAGVMITREGKISAREIVGGAVPGVQSIYLFCLLLSVCVILISVKMSDREDRMIT